MMAISEENGIERPFIILEGMGQSGQIDSQSSTASPV
jgi:hypothetical protein